MPVHRIASGPEQQDADVLEAAVKQIEANGEEVVQVLSLTAYPTGEWVVITRRGNRLETRSVRSTQAHGKKP